MKDYFVVNQDAWNWIVKHTGGGPIIKLYACQVIPFGNPIISHIQEPNLLQTRAIYENDLEVELSNKNSLTVSRINIPSVISSNDLFQIIKIEEATYSNSKIKLNGTLVEPSTELLTLTSSSILEIEESSSQEPEKDCVKTDSTGINTPLYSEKPENESLNLVKFRFL